MRQTIIQNKLMRLERIVGLLLRSENIQAMYTYDDVITLFKDLKLEFPVKAEDPDLKDLPSEAEVFKAVTGKELPKDEVPLVPRPTPVKKAPAKAKKVTINTHGKTEETAYKENKNASE